MSEPIEFDYTAYEDITHIRSFSGNKHVCAISRAFIERAYAALQAKLMEEEEAKKIKVGDWIICTDGYKSGESPRTHKDGDIIQSPWEFDVEPEEKWRKLTPEEVARLPKP